MGIREKLNEKSWLGAAVGGGALALGAIFILMQLSSGGDGTADEAFFTIDDGETWFEDDATKVPPFQHEGKEAVRAHVFECDGTQFVNHLERFTPQGRKAMEEAVAATKAGKPLPPNIAAGSVQVKKDGRTPPGVDAVDNAHLHRAPHRGILSGPQAAVDRRRC